MKQITMPRRPQKRRLPPAILTSSDSLSSSLRVAPFPAVLRVFLVQEIVEFILEELPPKSLLNVGLACHALYKPAMDRLWRTISIAQLLRCLPEELVERASYREYRHIYVLRIKQVPELSQWERVRHHAHRVKTLVSTGREISRKSLRILQQYYPEPVLLPNLRECRVKNSLCCREIQYLAQPSLLALSYVIQPLAPHTWQLDQVARCFPNLERLHLTNINTSRGVPEPRISVFAEARVCKALSDAILRFGNLTTVQFATFFHVEAILHLSRLPRLARLHLNLNDDNCQPLDQNSDGLGLFDSLSMLSISGKSIVQLAHWLGPLQLPSLKAIRISSSKPASTLSVENILDVVTGFRGLTSLKMHLANAKYPASEGVLDPLFLKLRFIEEFVISGLPFDPSRVSLVSMASAWPRLRNLEVQATCWSRLSPHCLPLIDLTILAQHCPEIQRISLPLSPYLPVNPVRYEDRAVVVTQTITSSTPSSAQLLLPVVAKPAASTTFLPSGLQVLEVSRCFEPTDYQRIAEFLAIVFPAASLETRYLPEHLKLGVKRCIQNIEDLRKVYLRARYA